MSTFADQHDATLAERAGNQARKRPGLWPVFNRDGAEKRLHARLDRAVQLGLRKRENGVHLIRPDGPDKAGALAGQGNHGEGSAFGVKFRRDEIMRHGVREVHHQSGLRVGPCMDGNPRCLTQARLSPVSGKHAGR